MTRSKRCSRCRQDLPIEDFVRDKSRPEGIGNRCRPCNRKHAGAHYRKAGRALAVRDRQLIRKYGIGHSGYLGMIENQNGRCLICEEERKLHIDHDHETGKVRGLLCDRCNRGLGFLKDSPEVVRAAIRYLEVCS